VEELLPPSENSIEISNDDDDDDDDDDNNNNNNNIISMDCGDAYQFVC